MTNAAAPSSSAGAVQAIGIDSLSQNDPIIPPMPASLPQVPANRFSRWLGRTILRLGGWKIVAPLPTEGRAVVIFAPHSTNWDGLWGFATKLGMGVQARVLAKSQLFWWPLGLLLRRMGEAVVTDDYPKEVLQATLGADYRALAQLKG